ncbi:MAG: hypothetical protein GY835_17000 [bacterium]|nr:hypothetical protein [bacterium]
MKPKNLHISADRSPFDQRDSVFTRARLIPESDLFNDYYERRPGYRKADDAARVLPQLATPGGERYRPAEGALIEAQFAASDLFASAVEREAEASIPSPAAGLDHGNGAVLHHKLPDTSPAGLTAFVKDAARFLGADDVGVTPLDRADVYLRRGRPLERHGEKPDLEHSHAIVLVFAMRSECVQTGPEMISTVETARVYQQAAAAGYALADALKRCGFAARAHVDSNYLVACPPLAVSAGLGELGRNGILVHPTLGPGVRLGVVTIDAGLQADEEGCWGIADFCRICAKCAKSCPSAAIPKGETEICRGAEKWPLRAERCYHYWRTQGTDCGVCMRVCPFQKPDTFMHRIVRQFIARTTIFNKLFLKFDDLIYGSTSEPDLDPGLPFRQGEGSSK